MEKTIGICIPTYNRSNFLEKSLALSIKNIEGDCPPIFISDNNSFDNTAETVKLAKQIYPNIVYENNSENLGSEKNFEKVLKMSKTPYSWLMGDDEHVGEGYNELRDFILKNNADAYVITEGKLDEGVHYSYEIFPDIIGHTLGISALILSKRIVQVGDFERYAKTEFVHSGVLLDYLARNPLSKVGICHNKRYVEQTRKGFCEWEHRKLEVIFKSFPSMIARLPIGNSQELIRKLNRQSLSFRGGMSPIVLLSLREKNHIRLRNVTEIRRQLISLGFYYYLYLMLISIIPQKPLSWVRKVHSMIFALIMKH